MQHRFIKEQNVILHIIFGLNAHRSTNFNRITFHPCKAGVTDALGCDLPGHDAVKLQTLKFLQNLVLPFSGYISTKLHGAISQKTVIMIIRPVITLNHEDLTSKLHVPLCTAYKEATVIKIIFYSRGDFRGIMP